MGDDCFDDDGDSVGSYCQRVPTCVSCNLWSKSITTQVGSRTRRTFAPTLHLSRLIGFYFSKTIIEMLRLCPNDNMGQRFWLGSLLIRCGRHADALYFAQRWLSDEVRKNGETLTLGGCDFKAAQNELPLRMSCPNPLRMNLRFNGLLASFYTLLHSHRSNYMEIFPFREPTLRWLRRVTHMYF